MTAPPRDPIEVIDWVLYALVGLGLLVVGVLLPLRVVPSFAGMFRDFGGTLPSVTRVAMLRWPVVLSALFPGLLFLRALNFVFVARIRRICLGWSLGLLALAFAGWLVALYLPIFRLAGAIRAE